jgi:hypothetical protein
MSESIKDERLPMLKELFISDTKYPHEADMAHFNNCDGCPICDRMMEFFSHCYCCDAVVDKQYMYYDHPAGDYYCEDCVGQMPDDNSNHHAICGNCCKRFEKDDMQQYHENFQNTWTCNKCVEESVVNSRFEIIDL